MVRVDEQGAAYGLSDDAVENLDELLSERAMKWDDYCFMGRDESRAYVEEVCDLVLNGDATPRQRYLAEQSLSYAREPDNFDGSDIGYGGLRASGYVLARLGVFDGSDVVREAAHEPVLGYDRVVDDLSDRLASWEDLSGEERRQLADDFCAGVAGVDDAGRGYLLAYFIDRTPDVVDLREDLRYRMEALNSGVLSPEQRWKMDYRGVSVDDLRNDLDNDHNVMLGSGRLADEAVARVLAARAAPAQ